MRQLQENLRPLSAIIGGKVLVVVFVGSGGGDCLLLGCTLHDLEPQHNPRHDVSEILDLTAIVGLVLDHSVMWDPCVDVGPPTPYQRIMDSLASRWPPGTNVLGSTC